MTSPRRARRDAGGDEGGGGTTTALAGTASLRGAILIGAAVVLGVVLLGKGFDSGFLPSAGGDPSDEVATGDGDGDEGDGDSTTTTTATPDTRPPGEVRVQVLNSTGPTGGASTATEALTALSYNVIDGANAADRNATATAVYAAPGFEADAAAIAAALGISAAPQAMPAPPPAPAPADASVVVVLGPDFVLPAAGGTTTTTSG